MSETNVISELIRRYPELESCRTEIHEVCSMAINCYEQKGVLFVCGNGGSAADADHIAGELMKNFEKKRPLDPGFASGLKGVSPERGAYIAENLQQALPAISLNAHASLISAISNDMDASLVFAQQIVGYGEPGDVLIAISTSGNSQNVIDAAITAKAGGLRVAGLTGRSGGKLKQFCDVAICVPADSTAEVQEFHLPVYHALCKVIENKFF